MIFPLPESASPITERVDAAVTAAVEAEYQPSAIWLSPSEWEEFRVAANFALQDGRDIRLEHRGVPIRKLSPGSTDPSGVDAVLDLP